MLLRGAPVGPSIDEGTASPSAPRNRPAWIHSPAADVAVAWCWVPFAVITAVLLGQADLNGFITGVFLLSFAHQPLTLALVYGDAEQFRIRRAIFSWSPLIFGVAIYAAVNINYTLLAVVGGLWNAEHTLMQRYGFTRIYGRKVGQDQGRLEKYLLFSLLVLALIWVAADPATPTHLASVDVGENNRRAIEVLADLRSVASWLVVPGMLITAGLLGAWLVTEVRRLRSGTANPAKWVYVGATVAVFAIVPFNPVAALMGYVGAHAVEYFVIVYQSLGRRYGEVDTGGGSALARAVRARPGRTGFVAGYLLVIVGLLALLRYFGSPVLYGVVFFTLGGLHVFYDGFIWKLRRPKVAASLAIPTA